MKAAGERSPAKGMAGLSNLQNAHATALQFGQHEHRMIHSLRRVFAAGANILGL